MFSWRTTASILRALVTKRSPYYIQFYINGRCNLKCKQCNIVETNSGLGELSIPQMQQVARNIRCIGGGIVLLTGGEPFLRRDLHAVAEAFIQEGLNVRLQTAGQATAEQLRQCYAVGCRDINVSLDSLVAHKQDYINSVPGTWLAALEAISRISDVFHEESAICSLGCVLSRLNFKEIPALLEFCSEIGWYLSLVPVHIARKEERYGFRSFDRDFSFEGNEIPELEATVERLITMKRSGYLLYDSEAFLRSSVEFLRGKPPTWRDRNGGRCDSPHLYFAVRPNGDFTTCCDYVLPDTVSLLDPSFPQYFKTGSVAKLADPIVASCPGCHYGSYPEVSLSVRDPQAFFERTKLVLFRKRKYFLKRVSPTELTQLAQGVRDRHPEVYAREDWLRPEMQRTLALWQDPVTRRQLVTQDNQQRVEEGRIRKRNKSTAAPQN